LRDGLRGAAAGAAATTALTAATYLDMVVRGRPASTTPEETVERLSRVTGIAVPGHGRARQARVSGLGGLGGTAAGVVTGVVLGVLRGRGMRLGPVAGAAVAGAAAMLAGNGAMSGLGVSDPRTWSAEDWAADLLPHLAYGVVAWAVLAGDPSTAATDPAHVAEGGPVALRRPR